MQFLSHSTQETEAIGEELAQKLRGGDVLAFTGSLGMGKTAFTRGLARGLGCRGRVTSPTFTIVNEYEGRTPLFHFDMYRLGSSDELFDIGWDDYLARGGVILTTGGYGANEAMVDRYIGPWASRLIVRGSPWITGENILMAEEVQALLVNMDQFYAGPITPNGHCNPSPLMHAGYGIQVNTKGRRFVPETWLQVPKAKAIAERTEDNRSFMLIGADADKNANILTNTIKRFARLGFEVIKGDTIEEAAESAGVPPKVLAETVREFNAAVKAGKAKELDPPYEYDEPHALETGPFYMIPAAGGMASTFGGPKINRDAQVINFERRPIPGLYAAGAAAGGVWVYDDIGGNQLGGGMVFGRVAARHAAARAKSRKNA